MKGRAVPPLESLMTAHVERAVSIIRLNPSAKEAGERLADGDVPIEQRIYDVQQYTNALVGAIPDPLLVRQALLVFGVALLRSDRPPLPQGILKLIAATLILVSSSDDACRVVAGLKGRRGRRRGANLERDHWIRFKFDRLRAAGQTYEAAIAVLGSEVALEQDSIRLVVDPWVRLRAEGSHAVQVLDEMAAAGYEPPWKPPSPGGPP